MLISLFRENALDVFSSHWQYVGYRIRDLCRAPLCPAPVLSQGFIPRDREGLCAPRSSSDRQAGLESFLCLGSIPVSFTRVQ